MKHKPQHIDRGEQALLQHYRAHSQEQPSAELDQRILAAARAELTPAAARPVRSWPVRLQAWLFGEVRPVRWSVAVASLAMVGLGLGLSLKTIEQAPQPYELAVPPAAAPAPVASADMASAEAKKSLGVAGSLSATADAEPVVQAEAGVSLAEEAAPKALAVPSPAKPAPLERADADKAEARVADAAPAPLDAELLTALRQVLTLREHGQAQEAAQRLEFLQRSYPRLDLQAELGRLPPVIE